MSCEENIFKQLRQRGFRLTPQREMVLSVMHRTDGFATAEEIYAAVQILSTSVDISTVYRTLDLLQDFHVVAVVELGDGQRRYRLSDADGPHLHLVCRLCGDFTGVDAEQLQPLQASLKAYDGFEADLDRLSIPGLCQACQLATPAAMGRQALRA